MGLAAGVLKVASPPGGGRIESSCRGRGKEREGNGRRREGKEEKKGKGRGKGKISDNF